MAFLKVVITHRLNIQLPTKIVIRIEQCEFNSKIFVTVFQQFSKSILAAF